jgi:hypothetical protein
VIVALRAAPVFASTLKVIVPLPVPDALPVTTSHGWLEAAVQAHVPADAVTAIEPELAASPTLCEGGESVNVHGGGGGAGAAACDTVKVCPAIVSVPERAVAVLAAIANPTAPLPVPDAPLVTVSHGAFDAAVHVQVVAEAVTATLPAPAVSGTSWVVGEIVNEQGGGGAPACDTAKVFPAIAIVEVRALNAVFAATLKLTVALPLPVLPAMLIHCALVVAVHAQVVAEAVIAIDPAPPVSGTPCVVGEIE